MNIPDSLNKEPFLTAWEQYLAYRAAPVKEGGAGSPVSERQQAVILNRFVRSEAMGGFGYNAIQATMSLEQSLLATRKSDGKPWLGIYKVKDGAGRIDGKIYLLDGFGTKKEISDAKLDELKLKYKEDLRYDEKERCYWIRR